jgi:hypothetical protein
MCNFFRGHTLLFNKIFHGRNGLAIVIILLLGAETVKTPSNVYFKHKQTDGLTVAEGAFFRLYAYGEGAA